MLKDHELILIKGGSTTSTLLNSISRLMDTLFTIGQTVGSSIRRLVSRKVCKIS